MFFLADCNNFYVSCERAFNPALDGKPVIVLSNNDGCAVALSQEAKRLGIPRGAPLFKCRGLLLRNGGTFLSSNYTLYADMSRRIMDLLSRHTPLCEVYSIDEAFLEIKMPTDKMEEYAAHIIHTVRRATGIPLSIGIGQTKTLAKAANQYAKLHFRKRGLWMITEENRAATLSSLPVESVWGIGPRYTKLLAVHAVHTALDFCAMDESWVRQKMTVCGLRTLHELKGTSCYDFTDAPFRKTVVSSRSFGSPVTDFEQLRESIVSYTSRAASKIRSQHSAAQHICVFIATNHFGNDKQYSNSASFSLPAPTNVTQQLVQHAVTLLHRIYRRGYRYKKSGIMLSGLVAQSALQRDLFASRDTEKKEKLMKVMDGINQRYGSSSLRLASENSRQQWQMKREYLSPCYTTRWSDLPLAKLNDSHR